MHPVRHNHDHTTHRYIYVNAGRERRGTGNVYAPKVNEPKKTFHLHLRHPRNLDRRGIRLPFHRRRRRPTFVWADGQREHIRKDLRFPREVVPVDSEQRLLHLNTYRQRGSPINGRVKEWAMRCGRDLREELRTHLRSNTPHVVRASSLSGGWGREWWRRRQCLDDGW